MRIPIAMVDVLTVALMDPTSFFKVTSGLVTSRSPLFLFFGTMIFTVLFVVIAAHKAH